MPEIDALRLDAMDKAGIDPAVLSLFQPRRGNWPRSPRPRLRASAGGRSAGGYWPSGRIQAAEGPKMLLRQFARLVLNQLLRS